MRELRTVLVMVPPLLAGLVRRVVAARFEQADAHFTIVAETSDLNDFAGLLRAIDTDVVIIGAAGVASKLVEASIPVHARVLTLSSNLNQVLGPGPADVAPFTPDTLAQRLLNIQRET